LLWKYLSDRCGGIGLYARHTPNPTAKSCHCSNLFCSTCHS
jgi:hypothetical protein